MVRVHLLQDFSILFPLKELLEMRFEVEGVFLVAQAVPEIPNLEVSPLADQECVEVLVS